MEININHIAESLVVAFPLGNLSAENSNCLRCLETSETHFSNVCMQHKPVRLQRYEVQRAIYRDQCITADIYTHFNLLSSALIYFNPFWFFS